MKAMFNLFCLIITALMLGCNNTDRNESIEMAEVKMDENLCLLQEERYDSLTTYKDPINRITIAISNSNQVYVSLGGDVAFFRTQTDTGFHICMYSLRDSMIEIDNQSGITKENGIISDATKVDYRAIRTYKPMSPVVYYDTLGILIKTELYDNNSIYSEYTK